MELRKNAKILISTIIFLLAIIRLVYYETASQRMDETFLILLLMGTLIPLIPWENITFFKAAGIELKLELPQVKGAISSLDLPSIENENLVSLLKLNSDNLDKIRGSRILWIDDNPELLLGERRLLRSLDIDVQMEISSKDAFKLLKKDNDFDLIISDLQRSETFDEKQTIHGGAYFIKHIREEFTVRYTKNIPIIVYSGFKERSESVLRNSGIKDTSNIYLCDKLTKLIELIINNLTKSRSYPFKIEKIPTAPKRHENDEL